MPENNFEYDDTKSADSPFMNAWKKKKSQPEKKYRVLIPYPVKKVLAILIFTMILLGPATISITLLKMHENDKAYSFNQSKNVSQISKLLDESEANLLVGNYKNARKLAILALLKNSDVVKAQFFEGLADLKLKNYQLAVEKFMSALKINKRTMACNYAIAICYHKLGQKEDEKIWIEKATLTGSKYSYIMAIQYYELIHEYAQMLEIALLAKYRFNDSLTMYWAGKAAMRNHDYKLVTEIYEQFAGTGNTEIIDRAVKKKFQLLLAEIAFNETKYEETIKLLEKLIESNVNWWEANKLLAETYVKLENFDNALKTISKYQFIESKYGVPYDVMDLLMLRGKIYSGLENFDSALKEYNQAIYLETGFLIEKEFSSTEFVKNLNPISNEILLKIAKIYFTQNQLKKAKRILSYVNENDLSTESKEVFKELQSTLAN